MSEDLKAAQDRLNVVERRIDELLLIIEDYETTFGQQLRDIEKMKADYELVVAINDVHKTRMAQAEDAYVRACEERDAARQDVVAQILAAIPENLANAHAVEALGVTLGDDSLAMEGRARALATLFIEEALVVLNLRDKRPRETVDAEALGKDVLDAIDALPRDMTRAQKLRYMRNNAIHGFAEPLFDAVAKHVEEGE